MAPRHLLLLGDSILDNAPYTTPKPDTAAHLRRLIGAAAARGRSRRWWTAPSSSATDASSCLDP